MKNKGKLISSFLISLGFTFNLFVFGPLEFYFVNIEELWFWIDIFMPIMLILSLAMFLILFFILYKTEGKKNDIIRKICLMIYVAMYIQGNYLTVGYGEFDVAIIHWDQTIKLGITNAIIWLLIISIPFIIRPISSGKKLNIFSSAVSSFIILIETSTLVFLMISNQNKIADKTFYLDKTNFMNMSAEENIVFFMVDSIESDYMTRFLEEHPEYYERFADFTFFDNATSASTWTYMSMPTILTGENLEVGKSLKDSVNDCIENSQLYDVLQENGYEIEWYVDTALVPNTDASNIIANKKDEKLKVDLKSQMNISSGMMDIVLFKYLPHCLKPLTHVQTEKLNIVSSFSQNPFFVDDFAIYNDVNNGATANLSKKSFKVIEMDGCHYPFNKTEEYERDDSEILDEDMDIRRQAEVTASMKLVWNYINMLKQAGVYDNTTIIVAADHGFDNMYNPTIMIKRKNAHGEKLEVSSAPISMIEDYLPTLLNIVTDSKDYGKDFFDYEEGEDRTRTVYNYYFSAESSQSWVEANIIMGIDGDARNKDDYYIIDEVFDECGSLDKTYKLGKKIDFSLGTNSDMAKSTAILRRPGKEAPKGSIIGHNANINLRVNEVSKDVTANFAISNVYFEEQHVTIQVNGRELFSNVLTTSGNIEFLIPKDVWNEKEIIEILINVPDAKAMFNRESFLKYGNFRSMRSIELKSIQFN